MSDYLDIFKEQLGVEVMYPLWCRQKFAKKKKKKIADASKTSFLLKMSFLLLLCYYHFSGKSIFIAFI